MQRVKTYAALSEILSADLDQWQDNTLGIAQVPGLMLGPPYVYSNDGVSVKIGAITFLNLQSPNTTLLSTGESTHTPPGPLANNTWYYIYAYNIAGAIAFESSTDVPDAGRVFRSTGSGTTRRYIGCYRTSGTGVILPFRKVGNEVVYQRSASVVGVTDFMPIPLGGTATTYTDVDLSPWLPAHSRIALINAKLTASLASDIADFITQGDTGAFTHRMWGTGVGLHASSEMKIVTSGTRQISYRVSSGAAIYLYMAGYVE